MYNSTDLFRGLSADLISAILEQKTETAVNLLKQDNVKQFFEIPNAIGETALYFAVLFLNSKVIEMLLQKGADLAKKNVQGISALQKVFSNDYYFSDKQFSLTLSVLKYLTDYLTHFSLPPCDSPLHLAVEYFRNKTLTSLITKENINLKNSDGNTPLHFAVSKGNTVALQVLIESEAELNCQNSNGDTALFLALKNKHEKVIYSLLKNQKIDLFVTNKNGDTALHFAVRTQNIQYIKFLVEKGCDLNARNSRNETPISLALSINNTTIIQYFFEENQSKITFEPPKLPTIIVYFDVNHFRKVINDFHKINEKVKNPIAINEFLFFIWKLATENQHFAIDQYVLGQAYQDNVQLLLKMHHAQCLVLAEEKTEAQHFLLNGCSDKNFSFIILKDQPQDQEGNQYLHLAARAGRVDIVRYLLKSGENPNASNFYGKTPLFLALEVRAKEVVKILLEEKPNFEATDQQGNTLLHSAILLGELEIIEFFLKKIAINTRNQRGESALFIAISKGLLEITKHLINHGADCKLICHSGNTIIHLAAQFFNSEQMATLFEILKEKLTPLEFLNMLNTQNHFGISPLHWVTLTNKDMQVLEILGTEGANIYSTDAEGLTPLHCAVSMGNLFAITYFIEHMKMPVDIRSVAVKSNSRQSAFNQTPLHCAAAANQLPIVKQLLKYKANVNAKDSLGFTPLHCAIKENAIEIILVLMKNPRCNKIDCTEKVLTDIANKYRARSALFYLQGIFSKKAMPKQQLSSNAPQNFLNRMNNKEVKNFLTNHSKSTQIASVCSLRTEEVLEDDDLESSSKSFNQKIEKKRKKIEKEQEEIQENSNPNYFNLMAIKNS